MPAVIDIHTHAFADALAEKAIPLLIARADGGITPHYDGTVGGLISAMDRSGVDVSVIQPVATKADQVSTINDWVATLASERLIPFGAMHPDFEDPMAEMIRMQRLGLRGFKMHPEYQSFSPTEPRMRAIYEAATDAGMIMLFHAGADIAYPTVSGTPESFASVIDAHPGLTIILAHLGGFREWLGVARHLAGRDVWLDTAFAPGHLPDEEFVALVRAHGVDRVLFGSDGPWTDAGAEIARIRGMGFREEELDGILGGNAVRLLAL